MAHYGTIWDRKGRCIVDNSGKNAGYLASEQPNEAELEDKVCITTPQALARTVKCTGLENRKAVNPPIETGV